MATKVDPQITTRFRTWSWGALARRAWGPEYHRPDTAYRFNNGRRFDSTDRDESGVYRRP